MREETDSLTMRMGVRSRDFGVERLAVEYPNFWTHEKNQPRIGANPPFGRDELDLLILTLASLLCSLAPPSSGPFGQILSPPRRLLT